MGKGGVNDFSRFLFFLFFSLFGGTHRYCVTHCYSWVRASPPQNPRIKSNNYTYLAVSAR